MKVSLFIAKNWGAKTLDTTDREVELSWDKQEQGQEKAHGPLLTLCVPISTRSRAAFP